MAFRVKTVWFNKEGEQKGPEEVATVLASNIWRLADKAVTGLSKADCDIMTPQRGFTLIGEFCAFLLHVADRMAHARADDETRTTLVQGAGRRLAEIMEQNIHDLLGDHDHPYQAAFIEMLNARLTDYGSFEFSGDKPGFQALRYLGNMVREKMEKADQPWVVDQIMSIEAPEAMETLEKTMNGFFGKSSS
jgi:hypothetical protein